MSSTTDKIKGLANEAIGNAKQVAGKALDRPDIEAEGVLQERKGEAQQAVGKGKDAVKEVPLTDKEIATKVRTHVPPDAKYSDEYANEYTCPANRDSNQYGN